MIASLNASVEQIKTTEDMITPLDSLIQTVKNEKDIPIQFDDELFQKFKTGIDSYVIGANNRTNEAISSENLRNTTTILIFVGYLLIIILTLLSFFFKWQIVLMLLSILILFSIPAMIVFDGYTARFYFYYSDLCGKVHSAMYQNEFPVANQGLGYYINCLERQTKSQLYSINYQLTQASSYTENKELKEKIANAQETLINPLLQCNNVYTVVTKVESDFCYKGMNWINSIVSLLTWVFIAILVLAIGVDRLEILVWRKKTEIDSMIENLEAIY